MPSRSGTTAIALLRGINVGGNRKVPMKDLKALVEATGADHVSTYVQSGNVVLTTTRKPDDLRHEMEKRLKSAFGFEVTVMVRTAAELEKVIANNPFAKEAADPTKVFAVFLTDKVKAADLATIDAAAFEPDRFVGKGREIYLHLPNGAGRSKLAGSIEGKVKVPATARNWRTVTALHDLAQKL
jgi:uncharacterized protein (DUF1697 family)